MGSCRVVQWATGITGMMALRALIEADKIDLVGVRVYDPAKVGVDAGTMVGMAPTGVLATDSKDEILALKPDVVLYMGGVERHPETSIADIVDLLAAGADVISTGSSFTDARSIIPQWADQLEAACKAGGSTFLGVGIHPGFWGEAIAPILSRLSFHCGQITVRESLDYSSYASQAMIFEVMGYGRPIDYKTAAPAGSAKINPFIGTASIIAKSMGLTVNSIEQFREKAVTEKELNVAAGIIPAGTVGAQKVGVRAHCGDIGIVVEHVTWLDPDVNVEWSSHHGYEIEFEGEPSFRCQLTMGINGEDHAEMACLGTAMHAVHAIPVVRAAAPGLIDLADVPAFTGTTAAKR